MMNLLLPLLDIVFPRRCVGCGAPVGEPSGHVCWECLSQWAIIRPPFCSICGDPVDGMVAHSYVCGWCVKTRPSFDLARSAARYRGPLKDLVHKLKYSGSTFIERDLAPLLQACAQAHFPCAEIDAVTFVPLHPTRERERTYNQSHLLAKGLAHGLLKPVAARCLIRTRPTATQTDLTAHERMMNMQGAFAAREPAWLEGRTLLLVDDVMTTGATVNECAKALKGGGAARVFVATVARG